MIFGIDFDGTIVTHDFPEIGKPVLGALEMIKALINQGHKIILFTVRSGKYLDDAVNYLKENGIELYGINENPQQKSWSDSPKAYCHYYIDDAAIGCPLVKGEHKRPFVDWRKILEELSIENVNHNYEQSQSRDQKEI